MVEVETPLPAPETVLVQMWNSLGFNCPFITDTLLSNACGRYSDLNHNIGVDVLAGGFSFCYYTSLDQYLHI